MTDDDLAYNFGLEVRYAIAGAGVDPIQHIPAVDEIIKRRIQEIRLSALINTSGDDEAPVATWKLRINAGNWLDIHDKELFQNSVEIPLYVRPQSTAVRDDVSELLMAIENAARMAEQGVLSVDGGQAAVEIRSLVPIRFRAVPRSAAVRDGWQPIETAPKDGTVIQAWHSVHQCPMSVLWKDEGFPFNGERLNWYERSYTTAWPERAFSHWMPLPAAPALHSTQEG